MSENEHAATIRCEDCERALRPDEKLQDWHWDSDADDGTIPQVWEWYVCPECHLVDKEGHEALSLKYDALAKRLAEAEARCHRLYASANAEVDLSTYVTGLLTDEQRNDPDYPWGIDKRVNDAANALTQHGDREWLQRTTRP